MLLKREHFSQGSIVYLALTYCHIPFNGCFIDTNEKYFPSMHKDLMSQEKNLTPASEPSALSPGMSSAFPSLARAWMDLCSTHSSIPQNSVGVCVWVWVREKKKRHGLVYSGTSEIGTTSLQRTLGSTTYY